jgi:o-succinylbenzoate synthase
MSNIPPTYRFRRGTYGINKVIAKKALLESIKPPYIILKPSLHGGFTGCREWIQLAEAQNIQWWMTSALESNVGLNAIAQFASCYDLNLHQGLGTGSLYVSNTPSKLKVESGFVWLE